MAPPPAAPRPSVPAPGNSRLARARARRRNVLWRRSDRWRSSLVEIQALALVAVAVLCVLLGLSVYQQGRAHALAVQQSLRPAQARVLAQPYASATGGDVAQVSWTAANGSHGQGVAAVPVGDRVGDRVQVWLDPGGRLVAGPETTADTVGTAVLTGLLAMVGADAVLLSLGALARARLNRCDEEAWDKEWLVYEPLWSQRR